MEGGVANERISPQEEQVSIVYQEYVNEAVPPQVSQEHQIRESPQALYVKGDVTNVDIRAELLYLTQLMMTQSHIFTNHVVAQDNRGVGPQSNASTPASRIQDFMRMNPLPFH